jgi:hypothetical protein
MDFETIVINQAFTLLAPLSMESKVKFLAKLTSSMISPAAAPAEVAPAPAPASAALAKKSEMKAKLIEKKKAKLALPLAEHEHEHEPVASSSNAAPAPAPEPLPAKVKKEKAKKEKAKKEKSTSDTESTTSSQKKRRTGVNPWLGFEKHMSQTRPELFVGLKGIAQRQQMLSAYKKEHAAEYDAFVVEFRKKVESSSNAAPSSTNPFDLDDQ